MHDQFATIRPGELRHAGLSDFELALLSTLTVTIVPMERSFEATLVTCAEV